MDNFINKCCSSSVDRSKQRFELLKELVNLEQKEHPIYISTILTKEPSSNLITCLYSCSLYDYHIKFILSKFRIEKYVDTIPIYYIQINQERLLATVEDIYNFTDTIMSHLPNYDSYRTILLQLKETYRDNQHSLSQFELIKPLGSGGFGQVGLYRHDDQLYAIKRININFTDLTNLNFIANEISALEQLKDSPYIVKFYGYFADRSFIYIIQQYIDGHDCFEYLSSIVSDSKMRTILFSRIAMNLIDGLIDIHNKNIVYMDLKLENILLLKQKQDNIWAKYIDFGLSRSRTDNTILLPMYDPTFHPEEHIYAQFGFETDIYALGKLFQTVLTGTRNSSAHSDIRYYPNYVWIRNLFPVILSMTNIDKRSRPTLEEIKIQFTEQIK